MGRRGPKKKLNVVRKWWRLHVLTIAQLDILVVEARKQLPLLQNKFDHQLVVAALVAREARRVEEDLFDANELLESFKLDDEYEDDEEPVRLNAEEELAEETTAR